MGDKSQDSTATSLSKTIDNFRASLWFIAWRCLYAATVGSRIDKVTLDLDKAYTRALAMLHSRTLAIGEKWKKWARIGANHEKPRLIPQKKTDKVFITLQPTGEYAISNFFQDELNKAFP